MSGRVPWSRYSGSDIEQVAGIFICTERPDSMKIRPSQGDHGIDILSPNDDGTYDVYQVKCFTANLTANQKNQIQKSWDSLIEYSDKGKITVSTWYLVMPLDPTPENLEWINALTPTRTIKKVWYGETKMDAWAAQMPNIIDYCFRDGADETHKKIKEILTLSQKIDVTDGENLSRHLALIQDHLNHSDPSYQYNIAICSVFDDEKLEIPEEPSYVWQEIHTIDKTHQIQLTAFPKYQSATEIDPRRWKTTVMPRNKEQQDVFRRALDFGTSAMDIPITPPQTERDTFRLIPESSEIVSAQLSIFGRDTSDSGNTTDIYILLDNSSRFLIQQKHLFTGNRGKHWQGSDSTGVISIEFDMTPNLIENLSLHVNLRASIGKNIVSVSRAFDFANALTSSTTLIAQISTGETLFEATGLEKLEKTVKQLPEELLSSLSVLVSIQNFCDQEISCPDFEKVTYSEVSKWTAVSKLLSDKKAVKKWSTYNFASPSLESFHFPALCRIYHRLIIEVCGETYFVGYSSIDLVAGSLNLVESETQKYNLLPSSEYGNMLVETALNALPTNIEFGQSGCLYVKDAPTNDEWNDFLDEAHKAN